MKKFLAVLTVLVLVCASVFAANNMSVRAHVAPYNILFIKMSGIEGDEEPSYIMGMPMTKGGFAEGAYGFGMDADFNYYLTDNWRVGVKADATLTFLDREMAEAAVQALNVGIFAKGGYVAKFADPAWTLAFDAGLGLEIIPYLEEGSIETTFFGLDFNLSGAYSFNDNWSIDFGAGASFALGVSMDPLKVSVALVKPFVGAAYKF